MWQLPKGTLPAGSSVDRDEHQDRAGSPAGRRPAEEASPHRPDRQADQPADHGVRELLEDRLDKSVTEVHDSILGGRYEKRSEPQRRLRRS